MIYKIRYTFILENNGSCLIFKKILILNLAIMYISSIDYCTIDLMKGVLSERKPTTIDGLIKFEGEE